MKNLKPFRVCKHCSTPDKRKSCRTCSCILASTPPASVCFGKPNNDNCQHVYVRGGVRSPLPLPSKAPNKTRQPNSTSNPAHTPKEIAYLEIENISSRELNRLRMQIAATQNGGTSPSTRVTVFSRPSPLPNTHTIASITAQSICSIWKRENIYKNICKTPQSDARFFEQSKKRYANEGGGVNGLQEGREKTRDVRFRLHRLFTQTAYREFNRIRSSLRMRRYTYTYMYTRTLRKIGGNVERKILLRIISAVKYRGNLENTLAVCGIEWGGKRLRWASRIMEKIRPFIRKRVRNIFSIRHAWQKEFPALIRGDKNKK